MKGNKAVFIDVKYIGTCFANPITADQLVEQCSTFINHPQLNVSFIINNLILAGEMSSMGYQVWKDEYSFDALDLSSTIYKGWFLRNNDLNKTEISKIKAANKSIILYDVISPGAIREAIQKEPTGILIEEVKEAVILSN